MIRCRNKTLRAGFIGSLFSPIGPMKKGELTRYGYKSSAPRTVRRNALRKAVQTYGATSTFRKVNALETLTKNTAPSRSKTYRADRNWVRKTFM